MPGMDGMKAGDPWIIKDRTNPVQDTTTIAEQLQALESRVAELEAWKFAREEYEMEMRERES